MADSFFTDISPLVSVCGVVKPCLESSAFNLHVAVRHQFNSEPSLEMRQCVFDGL